MFVLKNTKGEFINESGEFQSGIDNAHKFAAESDATSWAFHAGILEFVEVEPA